MYDVSLRWTSQKLWEQSLARFLKSQHSDAKPISYIIKLKQKENKRLGEVPDLENEFASVVSPHPQILFWIHNSEKPPRLRDAFRTAQCPVKLAPRRGITGTRIPKMPQTRSWKPGNHEEVEELRQPIYVFISFYFCILVLQASGVQFVESKISIPKISRGLQPSTKLSLKVPLNLSNHSW